MLLLTLLLLESSLTPFDDDGSDGDVAVNLVTAGLSEGSRHHSLFDNDVMIMWMMIVLTLLQLDSLRAVGITHCLSLRRSVA